MIRKELEVKFRNKSYVGIGDGFEEFGRAGL